MTKPLSPAAQTMLDATTNVFFRPLVEVPYCHNRVVAAALRAAADGCSPDWMGLTVIHHLYALADELEGK